MTQGEGPRWSTDEKRKGKEKARRPKEKNENPEQKKTKPYHTPQQFSIPQMLDLEGHQSLQLETTPKTAQHGKSITIPYSRTHMPERSNQQRGGLPARGQDHCSRFLGSQGPLGRAGQRVCRKPEVSASNSSRAAGADTIQASAHHPPNSCRRCIHLSCWAWRVGEQWEGSRPPAEPAGPHPSADTGGRRGRRLNFIYNTEKIYI